MKRAWMFAACALIGCGETEECKKLDAFVAEGERVVAGMKARHALRDKIADRAHRFESQTKAKMAELGIDQGEEQLKAALEARAKTIPGATFERSTRVVPSEDPGATGDTETLFVLSFVQKDAAKAIASARALMASPPLFRLVTVVKEDKGDRWRVELARTDVDELPIKFEPQKVPKRPSIDDIPSQIGFCGAADKRKRIAEIDVEIEKLAPVSEEVTVLLPSSASWEGLGRRVDLAREVETESRRIIQLVLDGVLKSKVSLKAIGAEQEVVLVELHGTTKERAKLQKVLPEEIVQAMVLPEAEITPNIARFSIPNRVAKERRRPDQKGPEGEAPGHPPHE
jgi:hypothetical protein